MLKAEIRKHYKAKRAQLSPYDLTKISAQVHALVLDSIPFTSKYVSIFLPIERQNEISTYGLLEDIILKGGHPILSKANFTDYTLALFHYEHTSQLEINSFGIPEPKHGRTILAQKLDYVFVPLLGLNSDGHRVGYGKGFYDQFLSECQPETIKIGLSFFEAENTITDVFEKDVRLDFCITPKKCYRF